MFQGSSLAPVFIHSAQALLHCLLLSLLGLRLSSLQEHSSCDRLGSAALLCMLEAALHSMTQMLLSPEAGHCV